MDGPRTRGNRLPPSTAGRSDHTVTATEPTKNTVPFAEQTYLDDVYARLDELREQTTRRLAQVRREGPSGSPQNRSERDAFATLYEDRLAQLDAVEDRLVFGRMDLRDGGRRYVGRIGLSDDEHAPMLTDWRAPAARSFYQATAAAPGDLVLRRHLQTRARTVIGVEDDVLDLDALTGENEVNLSGEGALLAALNAQRTGRMGDIVATIQAEQDAVIRSDLDGVLVVQGGPGTGKTAVALHRAAYLLYAHRERLERSGVLMIGPSRVFLRYIEQVLPSLGETGVVASTMADLVPGISARGTEPDRVAEIKGRGVWQRIIASAVRSRQRVLPEQDLKVGSVRLTLRPAEVREAQARARRGRQPHNLARVTFVRQMLTALSRQYAEKVPGLGEDDHADVLEEIRSARDVRVALNLSWMPLSATGLLADLYAKPHRLAEVAPMLTAAERELLERTGEDWTPADVPLIDEAAELIGADQEADRARAREAEARRAQEVEYAREVLEASGAGGGMVSAEVLAERFAATGPRQTTAERAYADRSWTYGHVVVDEAQELSAMAWRALLRRNPTRSMTIVGDVSQTSTRAGTSDWGATLDGPLRSRWRLATLTVNYRTPSAIMDAARRVAIAADPEHPPTPVTSARDLPDALAITRVEDLTKGIRVAVEAEREMLDGGRLAVVAARHRHAGLLEELGVPAAVDLTEEVVLLDPAGSKGLEFDVVVLAEPSELMPESDRAGDLYVAMTRPTRRLHVVHHAALPEGLTDVH
ncbi:AAA family ATPase [Occultella glacieicola]|uniref:AAA family ATPase n=1 Tax=Occultella glacieicola TaxID=2518684 RepID=A0ABY2E1D9_9MICO|nr:AAA family ATPase [Occultella glacieicola]